MVHVTLLRLSFVFGKLTLEPAESNRCCHNENTVMRAATAINTAGFPFRPFAHTVHRTLLLIAGLILSATIFTFAGVLGTTILGRSSDNEFPNLLATATF